MYPNYYYFRTYLTVENFYGAAILWSGIVRNSQV